MRIYKCSVNRTQDYQHASMDAGMQGHICRLSAGGCLMVFVCMHACMHAHCCCGSKQCCRCDHAEAHYTQGSTRKCMPVGACVRAHVNNCINQQKHRPTASSTESSRQRNQAGGVFGRPTNSARQTVESPLLWPWAGIPQNMSSEQQGIQGLQFGVLGYAGLRH